MAGTGAWNPDGAAPFVVCDATGVENALRRIERPQQYALARLVQHAPAAVALFDDRMRYLTHSRQWSRDFGLEGRPLEGLCHYDVFPEITWFWRGVHVRALHGETLRAERDRFTREDGRVQWLDWAVFPWHRSTDEVGGIVIYSYLRDAQAASTCAA